MQSRSHDTSISASPDTPSPARKGAALLLKLGFPIVILFASHEPRVAGLTLFVVLWAQRWLGAGTLGAMLRKLTPVDMGVFLVLSVASASIAWTNSAVALRSYPVLVNLGLLTSFAATLVRPPSMIERFARLRHPDPAPHVIRYTRRVTQIWCAFFLCNACFSAYSAWRFSSAAWSLYNGGVVYGLIGALIAAEWMWRSWMLKPSAGEVSK
jgi:uncharacterized membrane protein